MTGDARESREGRVRPRWLLPLLAVGLSTIVTLAAIEIVMRLPYGPRAVPHSAAGAVRLIGDRYPGVYDPLLGYVPQPGYSGKQNVWQAQVTITPDGVRSNGAEPPPGTPVVAVGDSFTFGDEVSDEATWPAGLERRLGRPVVNGGVFGYGLDQMVLRAEQLLPQSGADTLIVSIIPEDVWRCEFSYRYAWKPYFSIEDGALVLENVPVPGPHRGAPHESMPVRLARRSLLVDFVMRRLDPDRWLVPDSVRAHRRGPQVARLLVDRLVDATEAAGIHLLLVLQWIPGSTDLASRGLVDHVRERGLDLLVVERQLRAEIDAGRISVDRMFFMHLTSGPRPRPGHMTPAGNELVARAIAERLQGR